MDMIVCVKQVPDLETALVNFRIDSATNQVIPLPGVSPVLNGYDEQAVEAALRIKDAHGGKITVLMLGKDLVANVIKKPLAMGADALVTVWDDAFEGADSYCTAQALAAAIRKIGKCDLIFCGRQAADSDAGQVGPGIAEILRIPCVNFAKSVNVTDEKLKVERVAPNGYELVEAPVPCVITVSHELGKPRYPSLRGTMTARAKQPTIWNAKDLGIDPSKAGAAGARTKLLRLFTPEKVSQCEIVAGDTPADAGKRLALMLREAKVI